MLDTVSGHFISSCMILSFFFWGCADWRYSFCMEPDMDMRDVFIIVFASSCLVVSFACCNEVMIHGNMGDVMDWDLFSLLLSLSVYYSYRSVSILPILLGYPSHSPYCFPLDAYAYTCRYKHLYTTYLGIKSTLKEVKDNR